jgi:hypothetical protein
MVSLLGWLAAVALTEHVFRTFRAANAAVFVAPRVRMPLLTTLA